MMNRRTVLSGALVSSLALLSAGGLAWAQAPAPYEPNQEMIDAAKNEGAVVWYTSTDVQVSEKAASAFEAKYPGIKVQVERSGSERVFQRISQEYGSKIHNADVIETSDAVHFLLFKKNGWLQAAVPGDVAKSWPKEVRDPDGQYAAYRSHLSVIAYNSKLVKAEEAQGPPRPQVARQDRQGPPGL